MSSDEGLATASSEGENFSDAEGASSAFGSALAKILHTNTPAAAKDTTSSAVLSRRKAIERKLEDDKLEERARKQVRSEARLKRDAAHILPEATALNREKLLRKTATRGVVQLFNAVQQVQVERERLEKKKLEEKGSKKGPMKKPEVEAFDKKDPLAEAKALSKSSFLDLLKMSGKSKTSQ